MTTINVKQSLRHYLISDLVDIVMDYDERFNFDIQEYKAKIKKCTEEKRWQANELYNFLRECYINNNSLSKLDYILSFYELETIEAFWISKTLYVPRHFRYFNYRTNEIFIGKIEKHELIPVEDLVVMIVDR